MNIGSTTAQIDTLYTSLINAESEFSEAMGDLLLDGYYSDQTYAPGQEEALYNDAVAMMQSLSRPQLTYSLNEKDIANVEGYSDEIYTIGMAIHFFNEL